MKNEDGWQTIQELLHAYIQRDDVESLDRLHEGLNGTRSNVALDEVHFRAR